MMGPSLQKTVLLSFALHLSVFLLSFFVLKQQDRFIMPPPYTVNLVGPQSVSDAPGKVEQEEMPEIPGDARKTDAPPDTPVVTKKDTAREKESIEERIKAIQAKKNIERINRLRKIIALKSNKGPEGKGQQSAGGGTSFDTYYSKITREIWAEWDWPGVGRKDIEAIVAIRILRDGTAVIQKIEKSSGNSLFDKSVLRALTKASPLTPPPYEMEIGVRFYP